MKTFIFDAIITVLLLWYCGFIKITLNPFYISFPGWHYVLGVFIVILGMQLFAFGQYRIGYENGNDAAIETFQRVLSERSKAAEEELSIN